MQSARRKADLIEGRTRSNIVDGQRAADLTVGPDALIAPAPFASGNTGIVAVLPLRPASLGRRMRTGLFGRAGVVSRGLLVAAALVSGKGGGRPKRDQGGGKDDFTLVGLQMVDCLQTIDLNCFQKSRKAVALRKRGGPFPTTDRPVSAWRPAGECASSRHLKLGSNLLII